MLSGLRGEVKARLMYQVEGFCLAECSCTSQSYDFRLQINPETVNRSPKPRLRDLWPAFGLAQELQSSMSCRLCF